MPVSYLCIVTAKADNATKIIYFDFCGGNEFTVSCAHNNDNDNQSGPIQCFIDEVMKNPFKW